MPFDVERDDEADRIRIAVSGEVDMTTGERLERENRDAEVRQPSTLTIDLTRVDFLDSTGLQIVLDADVRPGRRDGGSWSSPARASPRASSR